ncbi:MAG: hypothetical protein KJ011_19670, partial [Burkholderiaceae bacterium]|nr:hypothetical protein [Burkholderiaceae bacterium]
MSHTKNPTYDVRVFPEGADASSDPEAPGGSLDYWRNRLAGLEPLALPHDHARRTRAKRRDPASDSKVRFTLPRTRSDALKALAHSRHATLSMVLMAAFQTLLMRYSGQTDVAVAVSAGRFADMLVMRTDLSGDPPFVELLQRVRGTSLEAHSHRDLPFDVLARHLEPEPRSDRHPVCQVAFALRAASPRRRAAGPCTRQPGSRDDACSRFDLSLLVTEDDSGLQARLAYDADLFERATIERMAAHLGNL